jgi:membrane fusion protein, heavy metal efflux system
MSLLTITNIKRILSINHQESIMQLKSKQSLAIIAVIFIGILLGVVILGTSPSTDNEHKEHTDEESQAVMDNHEHAVQVQEIIKGPHGGKLFTQDNYSIEVTIFEQNTPPEFRIYTSENGQPLNPAKSAITIQLERLGSKPQLIQFAQENDYLKGDATIEEPHSFKVNIEAQYAGKNHQFSYEQIESRVKMTDKQLTINSIEVLTAGPAKIKSTLLLQGEIKLNADKSVYIVPRVGGIVESVKTNAGDKVSKGQVLASISSQSIADMRSDLLAAQKRVELANATYNREKQLWEEKISAEQDYLQAQHDLQEAKINSQRIRQKLGAIGAGSSAGDLSRYELRSPIDGVVTNKKISLGQVVSEADRLFEVADLSTVWAEMTIYAKDINTVKTGQKVTIKATAFDAQDIGTISYVAALVGEQSRTAMARVVLNNPNQTWLPGLPVNIELISDEIKVPLAVSVEGIQTLNDWTVVFGRYGEYFEARPLKLGSRDDRYVEVLEGLNAGEQYAAGNSFLIKADIGKAGASHDH